MTDLHVRTCTRRLPCTMKALWCSCVLGLIYMHLANTVTVTQTPSSISEIRVNSSANITCSITSTNIVGLTLNRRFDTQKDVIYLSLVHGEIGRVTTSSGFEGRVDTKLEKPDGTSLRINFTLSQMQVAETDLYFCRWKCLETELETCESNGSIIIVNDRIPEVVQCSEDLYLPDIVLVSLSIISIPVFMFFLILFVYVLCKRFQKFTPSRPANLPQCRHQHCTCSPTQNPNYSYLSTSVS